MKKEGCFSVSGRSVFRLAVLTVLGIALVFTPLFFGNDRQGVYGQQAKDYQVNVNLTQNIVTVYDKDAAGAYTVPVKAFYCSVGEGTPTGTYGISDKYTWRALFGNVYGQYATRITGHILFHSVPYQKPQKDTLEYWEYNKLGTAASMGCIRLTVQDAKWIYDNCAGGTRVCLYESTAPEPITPEKPAVISENDPKRGWDPTDSDAYNPWKTQGTWVEGVWRAWRAAYVDLDGQTVRLSGVDVQGSNYMVWSQLQKLFGENAQPPQSALRQGEYYQLRSVAEEMGYEVLWNETTQRITLMKD